MATQLYHPKWYAVSLSDMAVRGDLGQVVKQMLTIVDTLQYNKCIISINTMGPIKARFWRAKDEEAAGCLTCIAACPGSRRGACCGCAAPGTPTARCHAPPHSAPPSTSQAPPP